MITTQYHALRTKLVPLVVPWIAASLAWGCDTKGDPSASDSDCPSGQTPCGEDCTNTGVDAMNCGACGLSCGLGERCAGGLCVCQPGLVDCGADCVDITGNGDHCGSCNHACPAGTVCSTGTCTSGPCGAGTTACGSSCVSLATDVMNCGACDVACLPGQTCANGGCVDSIPSTGGTGGTGGVGGSPTGGMPTGGTDAGGAPTGGVVTGGVMTGGMPTGGGGTGGENTGGQNTGGSRTTFRNPLNESFGSDPWMIHYNGYYYLSATTWDDNNLTMKRGRTVQELKDATPQVIWEPGPSDGARSKAMWAPEFFLLDNGSGELRWYYYFTAGDGSADFVGQRSHVLESAGTDPMGPYTFRATLIDSWAIDGSILQVDGSLYFLFSAWSGSTQNVYIQAMSNPWTVTGNRVLLTSPEYAWEQEGSAHVNEGPEPLYHDGRTFVTYSASQCGSPGYKLGLLELTGSSPLDPNSWWKSSEPVFQAANGNYSTAHNGFFMSPDGTEHWLVYHGVGNPAGSCWIDRTTRIQPFTWHANGLPDFGEPLSLDTDILAPSGE